MTWKFDVVQFDELVTSRLKNKKPTVLAHWHEDEWALIGFFKNSGMNVLVSQSEDGSAMTRFLKWMGYVVARGSSSRGGVRGLVEFIRNVSKAERPLMSVAVDGPKGPRGVPKDGIFYIAEKLDAPVFVMAAWARSCWVFRKSWSHAYVPKPFTTVFISFNRVSELELISKKDRKNFDGQNLRYQQESQALGKALDNAKTLAKTRDN